MEQLLIDLAKEQEGNSLYGVIMILGFVITVGGAILYTFFEWKENQVQHGKHLLIIGLIIVAFSTAFLIYDGSIESKIKAEIREIHIDNVKKMSCDEIRSLDISIIGRQNDKNQKPYDYQRDLHEWQQEYYYSKCEQGLKDEVIKLQ